jgi:hypothetical protein
MQWFTKYFSANDISSGYDKKMEELLLDIIFCEGGHTILFEGDTYRRRARFAAYRSDPEADGAFTS